MTKESYFEELSYALRRRGLLTRSVDKDFACTNNPAHNQVKGE